MTDLPLPTLTALVLCAAFAVSFAFGAIAQRSEFCTMGAIADVYSMADWTRARMWALAIAIAVLGFNAMVALGWVQARDTIYAAPRLLWLSAIAGGVAFGFGMVLASGCGSRNLVRLGSGNLKSIVVVVVLGISALATLRGITAVLRVNSVDRIGADLGAGQDLPSLAAAALGWSTPALAAALGGALALAIVAWVLARPEGRRGDVWLGGAGIGATIVAFWWVSGRLGHLAEHPETLEAAFLATDSRKMESLSMVAPVGYALDWLMLFSDRSKALSVGIVSVVGIFAGALVVARATRTFHWQGFSRVEDFANHLVGGVLMGVGGITALGCTVGQGLSGVSTLSLGSFLALGAIIAGAWLALHYLSWRAGRDG